MALLIVSFLNIFWGAFVSQHLWNWHVAPLGVPVVSFAQAFGIILLVRVASGQNMSTREDAEKRENDKEWQLSWFAGVAVANLIALVLGWVAS